MKVPMILSYILGWYWTAEARPNKTIIEGDVSFEHSRTVTYSINGGHNADVE